jgi:hypothetical protein
MALTFQPFASLANVQPISLGSLDLTQIKPLTPYAVGDPKSELIAQGISSGVKDISAGVLSGLKSRRDQQLQDIKDQRELARDVIKLQAAKAEKEIDRNETIRHNKELERLSQERIKNVTSQDWGDGSEEDSNAAVPTSTAQPITKTPASTPTQERYQRDTSPLGGFSFDTINAPEVPEEDPSIIRADRILGDLTAPMPIEAAPTPIGNNAMNVLANVDWSSVRAKGAGPLMGGNIPATQSSFYSAKPPASINSLGGISNTGMSNIEKQLAAMPLQQVAPIPAQEQAPKSSVPRSGFNTYEEARKYMESQADNPNWYASGTPEPNKQGKFVIPWKQNDPELRAARKEAARQKQEEKNGAKKPDEVFKEEKELRGEFIDGAKNFKVIQSAWNNLKGKLNNPTGASDMSMIFAYMKLLDPTSTIREGEYATASNVGTIPQTLFGKYNKAIEGNGFLDPKVRQSFINEAKDMYQSSLKGHQQSRDVYTKLAKRNNLNPENVVVDLVEKDAAEQEKDEMEALGKELRAVADKDRATYPDFNAKKERYKALLVKQEKQKKLDEEAQKAPAPQSKNNQASSGKSIFSNILLPPVRLATF